MKATFRNWGLLSRLKFQHKLLLSFAVLIIIPLGLFALISYNNVYKSVESIINYSARQSFEQSSAYMIKTFGYACNVSDTVISDAELNEIISDSSRTRDVTEQMGEYIYLTNFFGSLYNHPDIYSITLYMKDDLINAKSDEIILGMKKAEEASWYTKLVSGSSNRIWIRLPEKTDLPRREASLSNVRFILDQRNLQRNTAILRVDIKEDTVRKILKKSLSTQNSIAFIQNTEGEIYTVSGDHYNEKWKMSRDKVKKLLNKGLYFGKYDFDGDKVLLGIQQIPESNLYFISMMPYYEIIDSARKIGIIMLLIMTVVMILASVVAVIISSSIVKRIKMIIKKMKRIYNGEFETIQQDQPEDEIGELVNTYNYMAERLSFLIREQFRVGQEAKSFELKALQAQINPHFLYNTLDLINWTAIINNIPEISDLVKSLSQFYKLSLSKGSDIIPIKDELEHVRLFMEIQNRRLDNVIYFEINVDESLYQYYTLKIILQPLVENSILHGILKKDEKRGTVIINVYLEQGRIHFDVLDDGIGMSPQELDNVLSEANRRHSSGYGVRNINERIKLYYGQEYGLYYSSIAGEGTKVQVIIPAISDMKPDGMPSGSGGASGSNQKAPDESRLSPSVLIQS